MLEMEGEEPEEFGERVVFEMVDDRGHAATLECPACGFVFDVDAYTQENLQWEEPDYVACCPICKRKEL